jgi:hypothetical protein
MRKFPGKVISGEIMGIELYGKFYARKIITKGVTWTTLLHLEFILAYAECIRRRIKPTAKFLLEIMKNSIKENETDIGIPIELLTRAVISSHLQKYNEQKRFLTKITSDMYDIYREKLEANGLWHEDEDKKICPKLENYYDEELLEILNIEYLL